MSDIRPGPSSAFSLLEMLVVVALLALLAGLSVPAFKGLVGVSGTRGGADILLGALGQAQSFALEKGKNAYLAFPADSFSRFLILTDNGTSGPEIVSPRWFKLPNGVQLSASNITFVNLSVTSLPKIDGSNAQTPLRSIRYNRFGSIHNGNTNWSFYLGDGFSEGTNVTFTTPQNALTVFKAQPLTGKWIPAASN